MNTALLVAFARQRLTSPVRLAFLFFTFFGPIALMTAAPGMGLAPVQDPSMFALIFGVGMIGQDVSSGVLQLLFARPLSRSEYAISRWAGATLLGTATVILHITLGAAVLTLRGAPPEGTLMLGLIGTHVSEVAGVCAVIFMLSTFVPGVADLGFFVLLKFFGQGATMLGQFQNQPWLRRTGEEVDRILTASIVLPQVTGNAISWQQVAAWASTIALCLAIGIIVLNRKELSYAQT